MTSLFGDPLSKPHFRLNLDGSRTAVEFHRRSEPRRTVGDWASLDDATLWGHGVRHIVDEGELGLIVGFSKTRSGEREVHIMFPESRVRLLVEESDLQPDLDAWIASFVGTPPVAVDEPKSHYRLNLDGTHTFVPPGRRSEPRRAIGEWVALGEGLVWAFGVGHLIAEGELGVIVGFSTTAHAERHVDLVFPRSRVHLTVGEFELRPGCESSLLAVPSGADKE